ncbi:hypothetical protein N7456_006842 [Penicillium angulare]|uniref:Peptidase S8/S53 domain-containing protein n=1 Tax=Penicillium angulare TaxID=116970 RepID=A0A9W9FIG7_9EURO|nr:hypothetical protein N7456_006842 [Penicillium angulare]
MSNPENYTVGWICSVTPEFVAAKAILDEVHQRPESMSPHDNNNYTLGRIGKHNIAIAVTPNGNTSSAAIVATNMRHSFVNIAFFLMVVIGGGAPSVHHDIRLGDVVVGKDGVLQYDLGKTLQDQGFLITAIPLQPPAFLQTAVTELKTQYESEGHRLEQVINTVLESNPKLRQNYKRPDQSSDRLHRSEIIHASGAHCTESWCDESLLVLRNERNEEDDNPAIHYGLIASANQLMKDAGLRDRLVVEKNVLCFDVGAAGVANHFPGLVILGIAGYSDSHSNEGWQGYAAMTAAAYTKDLLRLIHPNKGNLNQKTFNFLSDQFQENPAISGRDFSSEKESDQRSSAAVSTTASWKEIVFDSAQVMSVNNTLAADSMNKVHRFFLQYRKKPLCKEKPTSKQKFVKIAILDTGIDLGHPEFRPFQNDGRVTAGHCRDFVNPGESPISDSTGHGTHCAHLVLKVCQIAKLYIAKVFQTEQCDEGALERIPAAIDWAVENEVDIIVMCFAFKKFHMKIDKAIREAKGKREFLIFAAASNNKHDDEDPVGFPASLRDVIRVNSCTHTGSQSTFSPGCHDRMDNLNNLSIIGEELEAAFPEAKNDNKPLKRLSGTSMSTAILAGVAGLVLEFSMMERKNGPNVKNQEQLLKTQGMVAVLRGCMAGKWPPQPPSYCYIRPWLLFAPEESREDIVYRISEELRRCM